MKSKHETRNSVKRGWGLRVMWTARFMGYFTHSANRQVRFNLVSQIRVIVNPWMALSPHLNNFSYTHLILCTIYTTGACDLHRNAHADDDMRCQSFTSALHLTLSKLDFPPQENLASAQCTLMTLRQIHWAGLKHYHTSPKPQPLSAAI